MRLAELPQERAGELVVRGRRRRRALRDRRGRARRPYDAGAEERALAGTSFARWLDATVAREQVLYGPDGEYAPDVFDPSGEEVTPLMALRQAERRSEAGSRRGRAGPRARGWRCAGSAGRGAAVEALERATGARSRQPLGLVRSRARGARRRAARRARWRRSGAPPSWSPGPTGGAAPRLGGARGRGRLATPTAAALRGSALARDAGLVEALAARGRRGRRRRGPRPRPRRPRCWRPSRPGGAVCRGGGCRSSRSGNRLLGHRHQLARVVRAPQHRRDPAGPGGDRERSRRRRRPATAANARRLPAASSA